MDKPTIGWRRSVLLGLISGFLAGTLWWIGLMIAFGPSTEVTFKNGQLTERPISVASRMVYAPLVAVPWAIAGLIVGAVSKFVRGYWVPALAVLGAIAGGAISLWTSPFDGWLALTMPFYCLLGMFWGMMAGVLCSVVQTMTQSDHRPRMLLIIFFGSLAVFCLAIASSGKTVSQQTEYKLRDGMSEQEVISIVGFPPGDYRTRTAVYGGLQRSAIPWDRKYSVRTWTTNEGELKATFDEDGKLCGTAFNEPKVSVGWLEDKWDMILEKLGVPPQRKSWCLN